MPISGSYAENDAITIADCYVEVDLTPSSSSYAVLQSWNTSLSITGETIPTTSTKPFGNPPIVFTGTKDPARIEARVVYTEGSTDPFYNIRTLFMSGNDNPMNLRYQPAGSGTGKLQFTTSGGKLVACSLPQGDGDAAEANLFTFVIECDSIAMAYSS